MKRNEIFNFFNFNFFFIYLLLFFFSLGGGEYNNDICYNLLPSTSFLNLRFSFFLSQSLNNH